MHIETALRRDPYNYLIAETTGARYCRLYAPNAAVYANTNPFYKNVSMVDVAKPDIAKYPDFATASYNETVLKAGEILFVPKVRYPSELCKSLFLICFVGY
jgi:hypothetical protein